MLKQMLKIVVGLMILAGLAGCTYSNWMPEDGLWYCEELQMQITFTEDECFVMKDGQKIACICENDKSSMWFSVLCSQQDLEDYPIGTELFSAKRISLSGDTFVVMEEHTKTQYTFIKVE